MGDNGGYGRDGMGWHAGMTDINHAVNINERNASVNTITPLSPPGNLTKMAAPKQYPQPMFTPRDAYTPATPFPATQAAAPPPTTTVPCTHP